MMQSVLIFNDLDMFALSARKRQFGNGSRAVLQKAGAIIGINPGTGHHLRAIARTYFCFIGLDNQIQGGLIHISLFGQYGFESPHTNGCLR